MRRLILAAALAATTLVGALPAAAQGVDAREANQQHRIMQGERSGELTRPEARQLERQQGRIARTEERMRDRNGGRLTRWQRHRLHMRQMRASRHIRRLKHNDRAY